MSGEWLGKRRAASDSDSTDAKRPHIESVDDLIGSLEVELTRKLEEREGADLATHIKAQMKNAQTLHDIGKSLTEMIAQKDMASNSDIDSLRRLGQILGIGIPKNAGVLGLNERVLKNLQSKVDEKIKEIASRVENEDKEYRFLQQRMDFEELYLAPRVSMNSFVVYKLFLTMYSRDN